MPVRSANAIDLALVNGKVLTMNPAGEIAEAVAVRDGKIVAVGKTDEIKALTDHGTKVIDLRGKLTTPGLIESHVHTSISGAAMKYEVNLRVAKNIDDVIELVSQKAKELPRRKWLRGAGYDDRLLAEKRHPTRFDLDKATTEHPVFLARYDGHTAAVNSLALELAKVTKDTPDPDGGRFDRDDKGEPNGIIRENGQTRVKDVIPPYTIEETKEGILTGCRQMAEWGFTSFGDADVWHDVLVAYEELLEEGRLPLRVGMMIRGMTILGASHLDDMIRLGIRARFGNDRLNVLGAKFMCDGSMSGWTAALYEPYANAPSERGIIVFPPEELKRGIVEAHKAGLRPIIHAIGDRAIDISLDAVEEALKERPVADHRTRLEHLNRPTLEAIDRMKRLGVIASSSVGFLYELGPAHVVGLGPERISSYYFPQKTYIEKGIISVGNSDWFVTRADAFQQLYGLVTRKAYNGEVLNPKEAISVVDAIRMYTTNAAYASFEEGIKGSIEPGKLADFTVVDRDLLTIPPDDIINVKADTVIVGGEVIYQRQAD